MSIRVLFASLTIVAGVAAVWSTATLATADEGPLLVAPGEVETNGQLPEGNQPGGRDAAKFAPPADPTIAPSELAPADEKSATKAPAEELPPGKSPLPVPPEVTAEPRDLPADTDPKSAGILPADDSWRYVKKNDRWWYWAENNRWYYYKNGQWYDHAKVKAADENRRLARLQLQQYGRYTVRYPAGYRAAPGSAYLRYELMMPPLPVPPPYGPQLLRPPVTPWTYYGPRVGISFGF